ncbi:MAG: glycosyltransferase family 1 protein [Lysobacteraceae bacterium]|nr:MAG: glycosyltransferase family 1 protein [Xanthomonadaceae bacterium]
MASERLHVLMLLESHYPSPGGGGAEAQVRTLARGLRARGHRVTVVTPLGRGGPREHIAREDRTPVCRLRYPHIPLLGAAVLWLKLASFLWHRRQRYDAWHVHIAHYMGAVACLMGRCAGRPVILKVSGWWELEQGVLAGDASVAHRAAFRCLLKASAWQAISSRIGRALAGKGVPSEAIEAIPNAVDTERFRHVERTSSPFPRFLFIGRLVPEKELDILLRAFASVVHAHPDAHLRLVGSGPLAVPLQELADALGIANNVEFTGHRDDIEVQLANADFGVLPSRIEGLSNTLLESLAAGLPMVATRISGSEDVVRTGDNGWLCEPGDQAGLANCMLDAASLAPQRRTAMGARARDSVAAHAGLEIVLERLLRLYRHDAVAASVALPVSGGRR